MKMKTMYQATDKYRKLLKTKIRSEFNHLSILPFDELNAVRVKKETKEMFERLLEFNRTEYLKIIKQARTYALSYLSDDERKRELKKKFNEDDFLEYVLLAYNYVTGYLYEREAERKRLRLSEEMSTARQFLDRTRYRDSLSKSANLWFTQSGQYAIDLEDQTVTDVWKRAGVERVQWISEDDSRTCSHCKTLNGQIFEIDKVPHKTHYNCRCRILPYVDDKDRQRRR